MRQFDRPAVLGHLEGQTFVGGADLGRVHWIAGWGRVETPGSRRGFARLRRLALSGRFSINAVFKLSQGVPLDRPARIGLATIRELGGAASVRVWLEKIRGCAPPGIAAMDCLQGAIRTRAVSYAGECEGKPEPLTWERVARQRRPRGNPGLHLRRRYILQWATLRANLAAAAEQRGEH